MSHRELIVLGTASQVPTRYRNHNGYFLRWGGTGFLFDPGEGTQRQMTRFGVPASAVNHVLVSHFHGDHCLGLPGIVQRISLDRVEHRVDIWFPASGRVYFDRLRHASIFDDRSDIAPKPLTVEGELSSGSDWVLSARRLDHGVEAWGYRIEDVPSRTFLPSALEARGVRGAAVGELRREGRVTIGDRTVLFEDVSVARPSQSVAFVMDTRYCEAAVDLARGADMLICESTFLSPEASEARRYGHLTAREAGRIAREAGVGLLVLTHFSQRYPLDAPFEDEARLEHPDVVAARDGEHIPLPARRRAEEA